MNIAFWLLFVLVAVIAWFCLSFVFKDIDDIALRLWDDAKEEMSDDPDEKEEGDRYEQR